MDHDTNYNETADSPVPRKSLEITYSTTILFYPEVLEVLLYLIHTINLWGRYYYISIPSMKTNEAKSMIFPSLHQSVSESSNLLLPESKSKDSIKEELRVEREKRTCPTLRFEPKSQASSPFEAMNSAHLSMCQQDVRPSVQKSWRTMAFSRVSTGY